MNENENENENKTKHLPFLSIVNTPIGKGRVVARGEGDTYLIVHKTMDVTDDKLKEKYKGNCFHLFWNTSDLQDF